MDSSNEQRGLHTRTMFVAGWLQGREARALALASGPEAIRILAELVARSDDQEVRAIALRALRRVEDQPSIDAAWAAWAATRDADLAGVLVERGRLASAPLAVRVLSALKAGEMEAVTGGGPEVVEPLLGACGDRDARIAAQARLVLSGLARQEARDAVCRLAIAADHPLAPLAHEVAVASGYAPGDQLQRALFYFLTGQWERYEVLDFDHSRLRTLLETADEQMRQRIAHMARESGRVEWVAAATGGRRGLRLGEMTDVDWEVALALLEASGRYLKLWRLAQEAPASWSARILRRVRDARWAPGMPLERDGLEQLAALAADCPESDLSPCLFRPLQTLERYTDEVRCLADQPGRAAAGKWRP